MPFLSQEIGDVGLAKTSLAGEERDVESASLYPAE